MWFEDGRSSILQKVCKGGFEVKKLLDRYFRVPYAKKIMFIYSRKELIAMTRRSMSVMGSPRRS